MKFVSITSTFKKLKDRLGEDPEELIQEALEAGYDGDYEYALETLDKGIYLYSSKLDDVEHKIKLWELKAIALDKMEKFEEALKAIEKAIKLDKNDFVLWVEKSEILHDLERYEDALDAIKTGSRLAPEEVKIDFLLFEAHELEHLEKHKQALAFFNKFLEQYPNDISTWQAKSEVLLELEKNEESLKACNEGLKIDPEDAELLSQKGLILLNLNKNEDALSHLQKSIRIDPSDDVSWYNLASALTVLEKDEEALDALTVATALDYDNVIEMKKDEDFEYLRNNKRFIRLAKQEI